MNFLIGWPLLDSSPRTCTTTPSLSVAWASTCLIFVWHSLNCRDMTFLWISYEMERQVMPKNKRRRRGHTGQNYHYLVIKKVLLAFLSLFWAFCINRVWLTLTDMWKYKVVKKRQKCLMWQPCKYCVRKQLLLPHMLSMIHFVLVSSSSKWVPLWILLHQTSTTQYFQCETSFLIHSTYRLPIHCFCQLPIWVKSSMNIGRIPPIKPDWHNNMTVGYNKYYQHLQIECIPHHIW